MSFCRTECGGVVEGLVFPVEEVDELVVVEQAVAVDVAVLHHAVEQRVVAVHSELEAHFAQVVCRDLAAVRLQHVNIHDSITSRR